MQNVFTLSTGNVTIFQVLNYKNSSYICISSVVAEPTTGWFFPFNPTYLHTVDISIC